MTTHLSYRPEPRPQDPEHLRRHSRECAAAARELRAQGLPGLALRAAGQARYYRDRRSVHLLIFGGGKARDPKRGRPARQRPAAPARAAR